MRVIHMARKPRAEPSVAQNVLEHGVGSLNIDGTRIRGVVPEVTGQGFKTDKYGGQIGRGEPTLTGVPWTPATGGRWPSNIILEHLESCRMTGTKKLVPKEGRRINPVGQQADGHLVFNHKQPGYRKVSYTGADGMEAVTAWECAVGCPVAALDTQTGMGKSPSTYVRGPASGNVNAYGAGVGDPAGAVSVNYGDSGGASRFFKQVGGTK